MKPLKVVELNSLNFKKEDSVIIAFGSFENLDIIHEIDERLIKLIPNEIGRHDMHEVAMDNSHGRFFTYGKNAEELFKTIHPVVREYEFLQNATVYLNFVTGDQEKDLEFKLSSIEL